jgi:cold shock CspA family protein
MIGNVIMFDAGRGFGFIAVQDRPNVFFHVADVLPRAESSEPIDVGTLMEFEVVKMPKGPRALRIEAIDTTEPEQEATHAG